MQDRLCSPDAPPSHAYRGAGIESLTPASLADGIPTYLWSSPSLPGCDLCLQYRRYCLICDSRKPSQSSYLAAIEPNSQQIRHLDIQGHRAEPSPPDPVSPIRIMMVVGMMKISSPGARRNDSLLLQTPPIFDRECTRPARSRLAILDNLTALHKGFERTHSRNDSEKDSLKQKVLGMPT